MEQCSNKTHLDAAHMEQALVNYHAEALAIQAQMMPVMTCTLYDGALTRR